MMKKNKLMWKIIAEVLLLSILCSNSVFALSSVKNNQYARNANGETYGYAIQAESIGYEPELIAATGTDGTDGYVRGSDLEGPVPASPEEALTMQSSEGRYIPLYESDGETVIGEFYISPPASDSPTTRGTSTTGATGVINVNGRIYRNQNSGSGDGNRAYSSTRIWTTSDVDGGYMGAKARIYGAGDNKLKAESDWIFNSGKSSSLTATTSHWTLYGTYYSQGLTKEWMGTDYWTHGTFKTPNFTV